MTGHGGSLGVVVRRYAAASHAQALDLYDADLPQMVAAGYFPTGQSWGADPAIPFGASAGGILAVTYRYDPWAVAERRIEGRSSS
jgi:hypothetical protein